jgi:hypothetical protein
VEQAFTTKFQWIKSVAPRGEHVGRRLALVALVVLALTSFWWEPRVAGRIQSIAFRRQCMAYTPEAEQVVFEEDPAMISKLTGQPGYELTVGGRLRVVPPVWLKEVPGLQTQGTAFLHGLTSPGGHTRLVGIDVTVAPGYWLESTGNIEDLSIVATVIDPEGGFISDKPVHVAQTALWVCPTNPLPIRFFAGQVDPKDPSHFFFNYERGGHRGTIEGRLNDDDSIVLMPHGGNLTFDHPPAVWDPG